MGVRVRFDPKTLAPHNAHVLDGCATLAMQDYAIQKVCTIYMYHIYIYINSFSCCNFDKYVFPSISIVYLYLFIGVFPFCSRKTGATGAYSKLLMRIGLVFLDSGTTLPLTPRMVMVCAILLKRTCGIVLDMADVSMVSGL
jgi:hypothetical protein